jgi:hypothetical protein
MKKESEFDFKPKLFKSKVQAGNHRPSVVKALHAQKSSIDPSKVN